ncbi:MAG: hypothetical protein ACREXW_19230 [Gammaproteobacteria bacterium]
MVQNTQQEYRRILLADVDHCRRVDPGCHQERERWDTSDARTVVVVDLHERVGVAQRVDVADVCGFVHKPRDKASALLDSSCDWPNSLLSLETTSVISAPYVGA